MLSRIRIRIQIRIENKKAYGIRIQSLLGAPGAAADQLHETAHGDLRMQCQINIVNYIYVVYVCVAAAIAAFSPFTDHENSKIVNTVYLE